MTAEPQPWTAEDVERLRVLWADGYSTSRIAQMFGRKKNSVVGKVHRLGLAPRPNPVGSRAQNRPHVMTPDAVRQRKKYHAGRAAVAKPATTVRDVPPAPVTAAPRPDVPLTPSPPPAPRLVPRASERTCQWLSGEPRERRWCGAVAVPGRSYCEAHLARCVVPVRRREEAA